MLGQDRFRSGFAGAAAPAACPLPRQGKDQRTVARGDDRVLVLDRERPRLAVEGPGIVAILGELGPEGDEGLVVRRGLELDRMAYCLRRRVQHETGVYFA